MNVDPLVEPSTTDPMAAPVSLRQSLSALIDGEMDARDLDALLDADMRGVAVDSLTYELIGDVLRGAADGRPLRELGFSAVVMAHLQEEPRLAQQPVLQPSVLQPVRVDRPSPANDALFRWKMVAGLASLAAVFAVTWSMVGGQLAAPAQGPQLAVIGPGIVPTDPAQAVVVRTPQGQVLRDARLEQLLAEHRQFGGMSALQAPAGFLRNATYDAAPQR